MISLAVSCLIGIGIGALLAGAVMSRISRRREAEAEARGARNIRMIFSPVDRFYHSEGA